MCHYCIEVEKIPIFYSQMSYDVVFVYFSELSTRETKIRSVKYMSEDCPDFKRDKKLDGQEVLGNFPTIRIWGI